MAGNESIVEEEYTVSGAPGVPRAPWLLQVAVHVPDPLKLLLLCCKGGGPKLLTAARGSACLTNLPGVGLPLVSCLVPAIPALQGLQKCCQTLLATGGARVHKVLWCSRTVDVNPCSVRTYYVQPLVSR